MSTTTTIEGPRERVRSIVAVFAAAQLRVDSAFTRHFGHHAVVTVIGEKTGHYLVTPAGEHQVRVRWKPLVGRTDELGLLDTPARAAGLILDHQAGLLP
jgi:hypothetical protein